MNSHCTKFLSSLLNAAGGKVTVYALAALSIFSGSHKLAAQSGETGSGKDSLAAFLNMTSTGGFSPGEACVTKIQAQEFNKGLIINPEGLIAGRFQGLITRLADGSPSAGYSLETMRNSSFNPSLSPLMVVDGMPVMGIPLLLHPHDIESITWLTGGQASGYGSLGRNGVMLIETRKGRDGFHVSYSGQVAISSVKKYGVLTGDQVREALLEYYPEDPEFLELAGSSNTDWQDGIYRTAISHDHHLGISGTIATVPFRFSAGQTLAQGTIRSSEYRRTSLTGRIDPSLLHDHLKITLAASGNLTGEEIQGGIRLPYYAAIADPTAPVYVNNDPAQGYTARPMFINPAAMLAYNENSSKPKQLSAYLAADYRFQMLPGLNIGLKAAATGHSDKAGEIFASGGVIPIVSGFRSALDQSLKTRFLDISAGYATTVKSIEGKLQVRGGFFMHWLGSEIREITTDYNNPDMIYLNSRSASERSGTSVYGMADFSVLNRYFISAVLREESFSEFAAENRSILSPSFSAEWNIAHEPFFPSGGFIDDLAISMTWGSAGALPLFPSGSGSYSPDLKPESVNYFISGLRIALPENRLRLSLIGFINKNRDMLTEVNLPSGSDFSATLLVNTGAVDNKGIEMRAEANILSGDKFEWDAALHFTLRENRVNDLGNGINSVRTGSVPLIPYAYVLIQERDRPVNTFYLLNQVYDENGKPIQGLYEDFNNNGISGMDDRYYGHSTDPEFAAGIWSSVRYGNWEFSFSASSLAGNWNYNIESVFGNYGSMVSNGGLRNISNLVYESGLTGIAPYSDYHMQNGSFLRLDFASLKHTFRNVSEKNVDISLEATLQHALVLTAYKGADPDIAGGLPAYRWPVPRTASLRLNIDF
jgi:iron complex outermembrane receptor protein